MSKTDSHTDDTDISMTAQELHILSDLDRYVNKQSFAKRKRVFTFSRQYGFLLLNQPENAKRKALVQKVFLTNKLLPSKYQNNHYYL